MSTVRKLKDVRIKIIHYLKDHKKAKLFRDDDEKLVARFWSDELAEQGVFVDKISAYEFLKLYCEKKLSSADVITRARRRAQEECEELRGKMWSKRHSEEDEVRKAVVNGEI